MNQVKIGQFIAEERKQKGYTQKQLAEILEISDKTISKWETGKGFPEISLLMPLCEALDINVNELLSGERVPESDYKRKAEENIMDLVQETQKPKTQRVKTVWNVASKVTLCYVAAPLLLLSIVFIFIDVHFCMSLLINGMVWTVLGIVLLGKVQYDKKRMERIRKDEICCESIVSQIIPVHWVEIGNYVTARVECKCLCEGNEVTVKSGLYLLSPFDKKEELYPVVYFDRNNREDYFVELYKA